MKACLLPCGVVALRLPLPRWHEGPLGCGRLARLATWQKSCAFNFFQDKPCGAAILSADEARKRFLTKRAFVPAQEKTAQRNKVCGQQSKPLHKRT